MNLLLAMPRPGSCAWPLRPMPTTPRSTAPSPPARWSRTSSSSSTPPAAWRRPTSRGIRTTPASPTRASTTGTRFTTKRKKAWDVFTSNVSNITCASIKTNLETKGYSENSKVKGSSPFSCDSSKSYQLRTGNYRNYLLENDPNSYRRRIDVAKDVLRDIVNNTDGVRFGLMVFNYEQGGRLVASCGSSKSTHSQRHQQRQPGRVDAARGDPGRGGPLLRRPCRAGSTPGSTYTSPMQQRCQKNYIILMTDGEPTKDRDHRLYDTAYINGDFIGDQDGDHASPCSGFSREYWYRDDDGTATTTTTTGRTTWTTSPSTCTTRTATPRWATARRSTSRTS